MALRREPVQVYVDVPALKRVLKRDAEAAVRLKAALDALPKWEG